MRGSIEGEPDNNTLDNSPMLQDSPLGRKYSLRGAAAGMGSLNNLVGLE